MVQTLDTDVNFRVDRVCVLRCLFKRQTAQNVRYVHDIFTRRPSGFSPAYGERWENTSYCQKQIVLISMWRRAGVDRQFKEKHMIHANSDRAQQAWDRLRGNASEKSSLACAASMPATIKKGGREVFDMVLRCLWEVKWFTARVLPVLYK